ncbi:hypothetical protein FQN60_006044 [Etheostoma spectabile]|uniref:Uncharacterized protein n=1 Tax=Etheostoma spectabile TaxID=54343 RepID=A0A5J5CB18_9PERO|nr:hypothetical protein FQN60_006044 [Etheostoma spectabile]
MSGTFHFEQGLATGRSSRVGRSHSVYTRVLRQSVSHMEDVCWVSGYSDLKAYVLALSALHICQQAFEHGPQGEVCWFRSRNNSKTSLAAVISVPVTGHDAVLCVILILKFVYNQLVQALVADEAHILTNVGCAVGQRKGELWWLLQHSGSVDPALCFLYHTSGEEVPVRSNTVDEQLCVGAVLTILVHNLASVRAIICSSDLVDGDHSQAIFKLNFIFVTSFKLPDAAVPRHLSCAVIVLDVAGELHVVSLVHHMVANLASNRTVFKRSDLHLGDKDTALGSDGAAAGHASCRDNSLPLFLYHCLVVSLMSAAWDRSGADLLCGLGQPRMRQSLRCSHTMLTFLCYQAVCEVQRFNADLLEGLVFVAVGGTGDVVNHLLVGFSGAAYSAVVYWTLIWSPGVRSDIKVSVALFMQELKSRADLPDVVDNLTFVQLKLGCAEALKDVRAGDKVIDHHQLLWAVERLVEEQEVGMFGEIQCRNFLLDDCLIRASHLDIFSHVGLLRADAHTAVDNAKLTSSQFLCNGVFGVHVLGFGVNLALGDTSTGLRWSTLSKLVLSDDSELVAGSSEKIGNGVAGVTGLDNTLPPLSSGRALLNDVVDDPAASVICWGHPVQRRLL